MLKRKTLTAMIVLIILAFIAGICGIKAVSVQAETSGASAIEFEYKDETHKEITGLKIPGDYEGHIDLVIPEGVTSIGVKAFEDIGINSVVLNEGLKTIGEYAFKGTAISSVNIPKSVNVIGQFAFRDCLLLNEVNFAARTTLIEIQAYAFSGCSVLSTLYLPDNAVVRLSAFERCNALSWVYVGENCTFYNNSDVAGAVFFPVDTSLTIVFPNQNAYNAMLNQKETTFKDVHGGASTYLVKVNCYVGAGETPVVYERLHGKAFNYVPNKDTGLWNTDTAYSSLPVQDSSYSATTWYAEKSLTNAVNYEKVNGLLETKGEIDLFCHETIPVPVFPEEPVSWVYKKDISYDINNVSQVLAALGCKNEFTGDQLQAFGFTVSFADEKGNAADLPDAISGNGVYSVKFSLKPDYGSWAQDITSSVTVNVNTNGFTTVMIVLLVLGILAVVVTVSTAVIRKKVQARNKKKQLSQKEILEKFKANGGETTLQ